jgi:protein-disulfide isomerase
VPNTRISGRLLLALLALPLFAGSACEKKKPNDTGAVTAMDRADQEAGPVDTSPLPGIDIGKLSADRQQLFYKLIGSLKSPCGKTHSLRTSFTQDTACKRAPYAVKYVAALLGDEVSEKDTREFFTKKYEKVPAEGPKFDLANAPRVGPPDAPIRLVEFFDYACPFCATFKPILEKVAEDNKGKVVEYFMMYPLEAKHPDSKSAAQAVLAAHAQGKFKEMHEVLFARTPQHGKDAVMAYAQQLGLDMTKFAADYTAAAAHVAKDQAQGMAADVDSTPTLFFNNRKYEGPSDPDYITMWIEEELAVNR